MTRAVPNQFASLTSPALPNLDADFAALTPTVVLPCTVTGTNALILTPVSASLTVSAYTDKDRYSFVAGATSTGSMTALVTGLPSLKLFLAGGATQAGSGDIVANQYYDVAYQAALDSNNGGLVVVSAIAQGTAQERVNNQVGVTSYTVVAGDNTKAVLLASSTSGVAVSLTNPTGNFAPSWYADLVCMTSSFGNAVVTMAVTSAAIDGVASFAVRPGSSVRVVSDGANWQTVRGGNKTFTSALQTITSAGALTLAHGLGGVPFATSIRLHCLSGDGGYSAGDEFDTQAFNGSQFDGSNSRGAMVLVDAVNLTIRYGSATGAFIALNKGTGVATTLTNASWAAFFKAWL